MGGTSNVVRAASTKVPANAVADKADDGTATPSATVLVRPLTVIEIAALTLAVLAGIAAARAAAPFLVPVVAAILLSYALRPLVSLLERAKVPRIVAAAVVVALLVGLVAGVLYGVREGVDKAVSDLPTAARKLRFAIAEEGRRAGPMSNVKAAAAELNRAAAEATGKPAPAANSPAPGETSHLNGLFSDLPGAAIAFISQILVALLLALFLLAAGDTFRRKVARIAGASLARRRVTVEVLNEIDSHIQAYLATMLVANFLIALATWAGLAWLGVSNAGMWATMVGVMHVIPYAGTAISASAVGIAVFADGGSLASAMLAMAMVMTIALLIGLGLASWMQGRAARMNPVAVLVGVLFFGWLWGAWGLLLGMPILAVIKSIADRIDALQPVAELLSS